MVLQGAVSDLNNFFNSAYRFQYSKPTTHLAGDNADTIQITVNDLGNTGSGGGTNIDFGIVNVDITPVNDAPVLGAIGNQTIDEGSTLSFTATDPDLPADSLSFSLDAAAIDLGMSIDANSGAFSWTPSEAQGGSSPSVTITDNGGNCRCYGG